MSNRFYNQPVSVEQKRAHVYTVGPHRIQNELLISFLIKEMNIDCSQSTKFPGIPSQMNGSEGKAYLFLFDCHGAKALDPWLAFDISGAARKTGVYLIFYNVPSDTILDQLALERGIHGIFYFHDPLDMIPRGLRAILRGELWYRRDILAEGSIRSRRKTGHNNSTVCGLTYRQREVLRLAVGGISNRKIAECLNISPNTVKSHVYNIYQKINVKNRLQASIWASQNLGVRSG